MLLDPRAIVNLTADHGKRLRTFRRRFYNWLDLHIPLLFTIPFVSRAGSSYAEEYSRGEECANEERFAVDVFHMPPRYSLEPE